MNQTPVERLLALLRTERPAIKLRSAAEIEALCERVHPVLAELSQVALPKDAQARLRGLSMGDSPALLLQLAAGLPALPELARRLDASPDGLRVLGGLLLELGALERGFLLIYEGADNALLTGMATGQAKVNAVLSAVEARVADGHLPAEVRAQLGASAAGGAPVLGFGLGAAAAPAAPAGGLDDRQAVAAFVAAVRDGSVTGASPAPSAPAANAGTRRRRAPRQSAR